MNISSETIDFIQIIVQIVQRWIVLFFYSDHCSNYSIFISYKKALQRVLFLF